MRADKMTIVTTSPPAADTLRAGRYRDARAVLDAAETNPGLPFPSIGSAGARFHLIGTIGAARDTAIRKLAETEAYLGHVLGMTFAQVRDHAAGPAYYVTAGVMPSGLTVEIHAWAKALGTVPAGVTVPSDPAERLAAIRGAARETHARITGRDAA